MREPDSSLSLELAEVERRFMANLDQIVIDAVMLRRACDARQDFEALTRGEYGSGDGLAPRRSWETR